MMCYGVHANQIVAPSCPLLAAFPLAFIPTNWRASALTVTRHSGGFDICRRAKLFARSGAEWKERATGDFKLLKNPSTGKVRLLVRQEKMGYARANHLVPDVALAEAFGSDRAWVWTAVDFAIETAGKSETFAARFKDAGECGIDSRVDATSSNCASGITSGCRRISVQ